jgi:hypothetical protein
VRIRGSRGLGKTSLTHRLLQSAAEKGCQPVYLSLAQINPAAAQDLDQFLREFSLQVATALHIPDQLEEYWDDFFGSTICCKSYFEEYLLPQLSAPMVLALDDVDRLFSLQDLADDFFGLLRAWHEDAKSRDVWQQLRLIVAHSTDLYVPQNINKSPFNVGLPIDLAPFSLDQVQRLLQHWQVALLPDEVKILAQLVGGRPDLVQLAGQALGQNGGALAPLLQSALAPHGPFAEPLQHLQRGLAAQPELESTLAAIAAGQPLETLATAAVYRLDSLGLVHTLDQQAQFTCDLYARWVTSR